MTNKYVISAVFYVVVDLVVEGYNCTNSSTKNCLCYRRAVVVYKEKSERA